MMICSFFGGRSCVWCPGDLGFPASAGLKRNSSSLGSGRTREESKILPLNHWEKSKINISVTLGTYTNSNRSNKEMK